MSKKISNAYRKSQLSTAGPAQRVVIMYDNLVRELMKAMAALEKQGEPSSFETAHNSLAQAERIVLELKLALDLERGGEIAENLNDLYEFWIRHLSEGNTKKDAEPIREILTMAEDMRDTWKQVAKNPGKL